MTDDNIRKAYSSAVADLETIREFVEENFFYRREEKRVPADGDCDLVAHAEGEEVTANCRLSNIAAKGLMLSEVEFDRSRYPLTADEMVLKVTSGPLEGLELILQPVYLRFSDDGATLGARFTATPATEKILSEFLKSG